MVALWLEKIPSTIDQYKAKNEVLEKEIPQLQEIAGKVWKKEDELKQLKSELAALDRKIQLELAPPTPEVAEKEKTEKQVNPTMENTLQIHNQVNEQSVMSNFLNNHDAIGQPGFQLRGDYRPKGIKL